jgi:hypothetical protein
MSQKLKLSFFYKIYFQTNRTNYERLKNKTKTKMNFINLNKNNTIVKKITTENIFFT